MFYLSKTDDIWTLSYEVSPIRHTFLIVAGVAGLGAGTFQIFNSSASPANWMSIALPGVRCVAMLGYWTMRDAATEAVFDLANRRIRIDSRRPLFGPARSFGFSEVAAIRALNRSGESVDSWEACIELRAGGTIRRGREAEGRNERIRSYLEEFVT
jgi:hypothetical protein